jgi:RHS repeat-associated protein
VVRYTHEEHERIEYTPYGEVWIKKRNAEANGLDIPYRFTGKERDEETGLYYYGARYLDGKASMWLSADPALGDYIPSAPVNDEARERNGNLLGMGGVFSTINLHLYHYAGNNPVKYTDPDGKNPIFPILLIGGLAALLIRSDSSRLPPVDRDAILKSTTNKLTTYSEAVSGPSLSCESQKG